MALNFNDLESIISSTPREVLALEIFKNCLSKQQRQVFELIPEGFENGVSGLFISLRRGIETKNVSAIISALMKKYPGIKCELENNKKVYWR